MKKLFVGNLPWRVREDDLGSWLTSLGYSCEKVEVILERGTGRSRGFGFLHFDSDAAADEVLRELDDAELDGRKIHLEVATSPGRRRDQPLDTGRSGNLEDEDDWA
jgi:RNA recognition motif-containing protein